MPNGPTYHLFEWLAKHAFGDMAAPDQFEVLLYDDDADEIGFYDDLGDIATEPLDGNYTRATLEFPADFEVRRNLDQEYVTVRPSEVTFDFYDVSGEVDTAGVAWRAWLHDDEADPEYNDPPLHLMARCKLDQRYDLAAVKGTYPVEPGWQMRHLF